MALGAGLGAHQAEHHVRVVRRRRPDLLARDQEGVAVVAAARLQAGEVRARARLRVALAPDHLTAQCRRDVAALLLLAALLEQRRHQHVGPLAAEARRQARARELLVEDDARQQVRLRADSRRTPSGWCARCSRARAAAAARPAPRASGARRRRGSARAPARAATRGTRAPRGGRLRSRVRSRDPWVAPRAIRITPGPPLAPDARLDRHDGNPQGASPRPRRPRLARQPPHASRSPTTTTRAHGLPRAARDQRGPRRSRGGGFGTHPHRDMEIVTLRARRARSRTRTASATARRSGPATCSA